MGLINLCPCGGNFTPRSRTMESRRVSRVLLGLCLSMLGIAGCNQVHPTTQPVATKAPVEVPEPPTILDQRVESIAYDGMTLQNAIQVIREKTGQNSSVDCRARGERRLKRDTPVRARLRE